MTVIRHAQGCAHIVSRRRLVSLFLSFPPWRQLNVSEGVGKSTIVTSFIKEDFVAHVCFDTIACLVFGLISTGATPRPGGHHISGGHPRKCNDLHRRLRRQVFRTNHLSFYIHNTTAAGPNDKHHLELEVRKAHVICVVYAIDNSNSFNRIPVYWLPYFRQLGINVRSGHPLAYPSPRFIIVSLGSCYLGWKQNRPTWR